MPSRPLAALILMFACTTAAGAQSATQRIAGPAPTALPSASVALPAARLAPTALGRDAMHRATRRPNVAGGVIGFVLGAAAGATIGCLANKDDYGVFCAGQDDTKVVVGALLGGAAGAAIGALAFRRD